MPIDYDTDVHGALYAGSVLTDAPYSGVAAALRDETEEQRILTTLEVVISHIRLLRDRDEARLLHYVLSRAITKAGSGGFVYDDLTTRLVGSARNPSFGTTDTITIQVIDPADGTDALAATAVVVGGTGLLSDLVTAINTASPSAPELTAVDNGGRLELNSTDGLTIVVSLAGGGAPADEATRLAGIEPGTYKSKPVEVADDARDEAVAWFEGEAREETLI